MKIIYIFILIALSISATKLLSQSDDFSIKFGGYVKTDVFYDTRTTTSLREGDFLLYPTSANNDSYGNDLNDHSQFNILSVQSRVNVKITGPGIFGAKSTGFIEAEFFGSAETFANAVRMRHAYMELDWGDTKLLAGQTWHPMFIPESYPEVLSFNTGVPFEPFNRSPQIRVTQKLDFLNVSLSAVTQRDFTDYGPIGNGLSSDYLRNTGMPEFDLGLHAKFDKTLLGIVVGIKQLMPYQNFTFDTPSNRHITQKIDNKLTSSAATVYFKTQTGALTVKAQGTYGTDQADLLMISGYGMQITYPDTNNVSINYNVFQTAAAWTEFIYNFGPEAGLFLGYTKNLGTDAITYPTQVISYGRNLNIDFVYRVSPRLTYTFKKNKVGIELEYTTAAYGSNDNLDKMKVINTKEVSNLRILLSFVAEF